MVLPPSEKTREAREEETRKEETREEEPTNTWIKQSIVQKLAFLHNQYYSNNQKKKITK